MNKEATFTLIYLVLLFSIHHQKVYESRFNESATELNSNSKYVCTNGHKSSSLTDKRYLLEFAKGPCSPVMILPGIAGSNLQVEIDCPTLRENDPETFHACDWIRCHEDSLSDAPVGPQPEENSIYPHKEYQIWIPAPFSPMTIFTLGHKGKECFSGLFHPEYNIESDKIIYKETPGVKISPKGLSQGTNNYHSSHCGAKGIQDLIPDVLNPEAAQAFKGILDQMYKMGYRDGLTLQAVPYDFRISSKMDPVVAKLPGIVSNLSFLTNKKVTLLAHSLGNLRISALLWNMSQEDKDNKINAYFSMAAPFIGALDGWKSILCGDEDFSVADHLGIDFKTFKAVVSRFTTLYQLLPGGFYLWNKDEPWMKKILQQIDYDQNRSEKKILGFFPDKTDVCYPQFPSSKYCNTGLEFFDNWGSVKEEKINYSTREEIIGKYSFGELGTDGLKSLDPRFAKMENFGVPLVLIYSNSVPTVRSIDFKIDPRDRTDKGHFCTERSKDFVPSFCKGDGTVPTTSSVSIGAKHAIEFMEKRPGAKAVKFVDVCSRINQKKSPYDNSQDQNLKKEIIELEYIGVECDCKENHIKHCDHNSMLHNSDLQAFLREGFMSGERSEVRSEVREMTKQRLKNIWMKCEVLNEELILEEVVDI